MMTSDGCRIQAGYTSTMLGLAVSACFIAHSSELLQ